MRSPLLFAFIVALCPALPAQQHTKVASIARPEQPPFVGEWRQEGAEYPFALRIAATAGNWSIRGWGFCQPQACDWGERQLTMLSTSASSTDVQRAFATWDHGYATRHVTLRMEGDTLIAEFYVLFRDQSGRSYYFQVERFVKGKVPARD